MAKQISGVWNLVSITGHLPDHEIVQDVRFTMNYIGDYLELVVMSISQVRINNGGIYVIVDSVESIRHYDTPYELKLFAIPPRIDFGAEPQEVSDEFYELTASSYTAMTGDVRIIPAGQYRIKKTVTEMVTGENLLFVEPLEFYCSGYSRGNGNYYTAYCSGIIEFHDENGPSEIAYLVYKTNPEYPEQVPSRVFTHNNGEYFDGLVYDDPLLITVPRDAAVTPAFFEWFEQNTISTYKVNVSYGDKTVAKLLAGQTATLRCADKKMEGDVTVETHMLEGEEVEHYDGSYTVLRTSEGLEFAAVDGGYEVSGLGECTDKYVVIPREHNGLPVVGIGFDAFQHYIGIRGVVIPDSVTYIDRYAFSNCHGLVYVTIPDSVRLINHNAFALCYKLASITIPNNVTSIESDTFNECYSLENVTIGNGVTRIESSAFAFCTRLKSITIPASVKEINWRTFYGCTNLKDIYVPWSEGEVADAPWSADNATIHYNSEV